MNTNQKSTHSINLLSVLDTSQINRRTLMVLGSSIAINLSGCGSGETSSSSGSGSGSGSGSTLQGVVTTLAGSTSSGSSDGTGSSASFNQPTGVAVDSSGNVYVADKGNNLIRKITSAGAVTTFAGDGNAASSDGTGTTASFDTPTGVAVDTSGNVYVAEYSSTGNIRMITPGGAVSTLANVVGAYGITIDNNGRIYVADRDHHNIWVGTIANLTSTLTVLAGDGNSGYIDDTGSLAEFYQPTGVAVDGSGNVYVADSRNHIVRKVTSTGVVTTLAGSNSQGSSNGTGTSASFSKPTGVAVGTSGNVYVAEFSNHMIRVVTSSGVVTTLAGSTSSGSSDGTGSSATFNQPTGVAVDTSGNVYVADSGNNMIRKIT